MRNTFLSCNTFIIIDFNWKSALSYIYNLYFQCNINGAQGDGTQAGTCGSSLRCQSDGSCKVWTMSCKTNEGSRMSYELNER